MALDSNGLRIHLERQKRVAEKIAALWRCEWGSMGEFNPIDVFFMRKREIFAFAEIRTKQDVLSDKSIVFVDFDKWLNMRVAGMALRLPVHYIAAYVNGIWIADLGHVEIDRYRIMQRGRRDRPQMRNDYCPVIEIPAGVFKQIVPLSDDIFADVLPSQPAQPVQQQHAPIDPALSTFL
jgi:hypothetical protein